MLTKIVTPSCVINNVVCHIMSINKIIKEEYKVFPIFLLGGGTFFFAADCLPLVMLLLGAISRNVSRLSK